MRRFKFVLGAFILAVTLALTTTSCEELLELDGSVVVYNTTGSTIIADVVDGNGSWVGEKTIYSGSSKTFTNVASGSVKGAARFYGRSTWYYSSVKTLTGGSSISITWYPTKKSTQAVDSIYAK